MQSIGMTHNKHNPSFQRFPLQHVTRNRNNTTAKTWLLRMDVCHSERRCLPVLRLSRHSFKSLLETWLFSRKHFSRYLDPQTLMVFKHMCFPASQISTFSKTLKGSSWQAKLECSSNLDPKLTMQTVKWRDLILPKMQISIEVCP